jgi:tripartite-type tricarboxylate transporter receptor subunit TctC
MMAKMFRWKFSQKVGPLGSVAGFFAFLIIASLTILVLPTNSCAKDWPTKPITIIVPWAIGASSDHNARLLAPKMSKILGVPVQVVNKPGAGAVIGALEVVKSPPDGYTLLLDGVASAVQAAWGTQLPYKVEERTHIAQFSTLPYLFVMVPGSSPWKNMSDLMNAIRTNPNPASIRWSAVGGGPMDVFLLQVQSAFEARGVDISKISTVVYKGTGDVAIAVAGGHVEIGAGDPGAARALVSAGKIRLLAVSGDKRYKEFPDVPSMTEAGFPSVKYSLWSGLSGPPNMPQNIVKTLANAVGEVTKDPDYIDKLDKQLGQIPTFLPEDSFRKTFLDEVKFIKSLKTK